MTEQLRDPAPARPVAHRRTFERERSARDPELISLDRSRQPDR